MAAALVLSAAAYPAFAATYALLAWYVQYEHLPVPSVLTIVVPGVLCALTFIPNGMPSGKAAGKPVAVTMWTGEDAQCGNEFPRLVTPSVPSTKCDASAITEAITNTAKFEGMISPSSGTILNSRVPPSRTSCVPTSPVSVNQC